MNRRPYPSLDSLLIDDYDIKLLLCVSKYHKEILILCVSKYHKELLITTKIY